MQRDQAQIPPGGEVCLELSTVLLALAITVTDPDVAQGLAENSKVRTVSGTPLSTTGFQDALRGFLDAPDQAEQGEKLKRVVGNIDLPPEKPHIGRRCVVVVVVVPTLPQGDESQKHAVAAGVRRLIAHPSKHVAKRVDDKRTMVQKYRADEKAPNQSLPPHDKEARDCQRDPWNDVKAIQPAQLGILGKILDRVEIRRLILAGQDPTYMRPPKAFVFR